MATTTPPSDLDDDRVARAKPHVKDALLTLLAGRAEATVTLSDLDRATPNPRAAVEAAMVEFRAQAQRHEGVSIERQPGNPVRWEVRRDVGDEE